MHKSFVSCVGRCDHLGDPGTAGAFLRLTYTDRSATHGIVLTHGQAQRLMAEMTEALNPVRDAERGDQAVSRTGGANPPTGATTIKDYPTTDIRRTRGIIEDECDKMFEATGIGPWNDNLRREVERAMWRVVGRELADRVDEGWRKMPDGSRNDDLSLWLRQEAASCEDIARNARSKADAAAFVRKAANYRMAADEIELVDEITPEMIRAASESRAMDDEGEFPSLGDLLGFSGENKTRTVVRRALEAALSVPKSP